MRAVTILGLALSSSAAAAQELAVYVGASVGEFDHQNETGGAFSDSVSSWKIYGGFQAGRHFSLEVALGETGAIEADPPSPLTVATLRLQNAQSVRFDLTTVRLLGILPLKRIDLWMGLGGYTMDAEVDFVSPFGVPSSLSVGEPGELLAMGVDWKLGLLDQPLRVRLEYESLDFGFSDASTVAIGLGYRFGDL